MKIGARIEICYKAELSGLTGVITNVFHDHCTWGHAIWVQVKLDNGTMKVLKSCFVREI